MMERNIELKKTELVLKDSEIDGIQRILRECKITSVKVNFIEEKEAEQFKVTFYRSSQSG